MKTFSLEHVDIANWIRIQVHEGCARVVLRQKVGEGEAHVREWTLFPETDADAVAEQITAKVHDEGLVLRGPTTYALLAYKPGSLSYFDRKLFRFEGMGGSADVLLGETEAPDGKGLVSQMMRHTEASARIGLGQTLAIVEHYKQILRERDARIAALEERQAEVIAMHEQLISMKHERNLDEIREKRIDRKETFVRQKLDMLTPVLMSKMLGAGAPGGQGPVLGEEILRQFLKSLAPEQIAAMTQTLSHEQVIALQEIWARYSDREERQQKAAEEAEAREAAGTDANQPAPSPSDAPKEEK